jgi:hypothetical protein
MIKVTLTFNANDEEIRWAAYKLLSLNQKLNKRAIKNYLTQAILQNGTDPISLMGDLKQVFHNYCYSNMTEDERSILAAADFWLNKNYRQQEATA